MSILYNIRVANTIADQKPDNFTRIINETKDYFKGDNDISLHKVGNKSKKNYKTIIQELTQKRYLWFIGSYSNLIQYQ